MSDNNDDSYLHGAIGGQPSYNYRMGTLGWMAATARELDEQRIREGSGTKIFQDTGAAGDSRRQLLIAVLVPALTPPLILFSWLLVEFEQRPVVLGIEAGAVIIVFFGLRWIASILSRGLASVVCLLYFGLSYTYVSSLFSLQPKWMLAAGGVGMLVGCIVGWALWPQFSKDS